MARRIRRTNRNNSKRLNSRRRSKVRNHRNTMKRRNTRRMGGAESESEPEGQLINLVTGNQPVIEYLIKVMNQRPLARALQTKLSGLSTQVPRQADRYGPR